MTDDYKYYWDEMIRWLFISMNIEQITLDEWWNGDETEGWNEKPNCWENAERFF